MYLHYTDMCFTLFGMLLKFIGISFATGYIKYIRISTKLHKEHYFKMATHLALLIFDNDFKYF